MNQSLLVFVNESRLLPKLGSSLFTFEVAIPIRQGHTLPKEISSIGLIDNTGIESRFIAKLDGLKRFDEEGATVFMGQQGRSYYASRAQNTWPTWLGARIERSVEPLQTLLVPHEELLNYCKNLGASGHRKIGMLDPSVISYVDAHVKRTYKSQQAALIEIESILRSRFTLDELTISAADTDSLDAFESSAKSSFHLLTSRGQVTVSHGSLGLQDVDLGLRPITEVDFAPRKFSPKMSQDQFGASQKLERAEQTHQRILKDIVQFLESRGYEPLMSESIDLALDLQSSRVICEIKSATIENFEKQFQTGITQIKMYEFAMKTESNPEVTPFLIIEKPSDAKLDVESISGFCDFVGCKLFLWDASLDRDLRFGDLSKSLASL